MSAGEFGQGLLAMLMLLVLCAVAGFLLWLLLS